TTDFTFADSFNASADSVEAIQRFTTAAETTGRFAILGSTNYTDSQIDARIYASATGPAGSQGLILRWTDSSNHLRLMVPLPGSSAGVLLEQVVAGTPTTLGSSAWTRVSTGLYRLRLVAYATGLIVAQVFSDAGAELVSLSASSTATATGGTLQTGKPGVRDVGTTTGSIRRFTAISVSTPPAEPIAIYSGRNMQISSDDVIRQDATGTYTGRPQSYRGSRFVAPVGTSRVFVKARRNDVDVATDDQVTDATQIQIVYTPRGLAVPR
ncbi:MAG TPA: hypothetical protein VGM91_14365, partial [Conexibacter sp.]